MAKAKQPELRQANLTREKMSISIPKIERRINDLEQFDVSSVNDRSDPRIGALAGKLDDLLVSIFGADTVEYERYKWDITHLDRASMNMMYETTIYEVRKGLQSGLASAKVRLQAIKEGFLEEIGDAAGIAVVNPPLAPQLGKEVFIVHGHDDGLMQGVARLIEKLSLTSVILHEQPNQGRTIIEKFELHSDVGFAVVLLTPDDIGGAQKAAQNPRARQNVILELGYFIGKLGRNRVCALYSEGVELPSDLSGILYVKYDAGGAWKIKLAKEIKAAGIDVDLNQVD